LVPVTRWRIGGADSETKNPPLICQRWVFKSLFSLLVDEPPIASRRVLHRDTVRTRSANQRGGTLVRKNVVTIGVVHFIN
jgi:hypothetical protein